MGTSLKHNGTSSGRIRKKLLEEFSEKLLDKFSLDLLEEIAISLELMWQINNRIVDQFTP